MLISAAQRHPHAPHTVHKPWLTPGAKAVHTCQQRCRTTFAGEADAPQALATFAPRVRATCLHPAALRPRPRDDTRGRPSHGAFPAQGIDMLDGALASSIAAPQPLVNQQRGGMLATNELDQTQFPPQELFAGDTGQALAERGGRVLNAPRFLAALLSRTKPERRMALVMVMTVCWLGYAALAYRIRKALQAHGATFPNHNGQPVQHPTVRWVFPYVVGIHVLLIPGEGPLVRNLADAHQRWLRPLGNPDMGLYGINYS